MLTQLTGLTGSLGFWMTRAEGAEEKIWNKYIGLDAQLTVANRVLTQYLTA